MKGFLAILLIGASLSAANVIKYEYAGVLKAGVPQVGTESFATGFKAIVEADYQPGKVVAWMTNIQTAEYQGMIGDSLRDWVPMEWKPSSVPGIQSKWTIHTKARDGNQVFEFDSSDSLIAINIKKSIAQHLRIPHRVDMGPNMWQDAVAGVLGETKRYDDTFLGTCEMEKSLTRVPSEVAQRVAQSLPSSAGSAVSGEMWLVRTSLNMQNCTDQVLLQQAGVGNTTRHRGQAEYMSAQSSVGRYYLQGSNPTQGNAKLVYAVIEGFAAQKAYKFGHGQIQVLTNTTFRMVSPSSSSKAPSSKGSPKESRTWKMEVESPYSPPSQIPEDKKLWVQYLQRQSNEVPMFLEKIFTGLNVNQTMEDSMKNNAISLLKEAAKEALQPPRAPESDNMKGTNIGESVRKVYVVSKILGRMTYPNAQKVVEAIYSQQGKSEQDVLQRALLADALAASGSGVSMRLLMDLIKQKKISTERTVSLFATLAATMKSPSMIKDIFATVQTLDWASQSAMVGNVYINFAHLMNQQCVRLGNRNYTLPSPVLGSEVCDRSVVPQWVEFLKSKYQSSSAESQKLMIIWAMAHIGSTESNQFLEPIILNRDPSVTPFVRATAVRSMHRYRQSPRSRKWSIQLLMRVAMDEQANEYVRQAAVETILTWRPDMGWWNNMAHLTWSERSLEFRAFLISTIHHYSQLKTPFFRHQAKYAAQVKHSMRPLKDFMTVATNRVFANLYWKRWISSIWDMKHMVGAQSGSQYYANEIFTGVKANLDGFHIDLLETRSFMKRPFVHQNQKDQDATVQWKPTVPIQKAIYEVIEKVLSRGSSSGGVNTEYYQLLRLVENMHVFVSSEKQFIQSFLKGSAVSKLMSGESKSLTASKYFNPVSIKSCIPSDIGIAYCSSITAPTMLVLDGNVLSKQSEQGKYHSEVEAKFGFSSKIFASMEVFVPWSQRTLTTGWDTEKTIAVPAKFMITVQNQFAEGISGHQLSVALDALTTEQSKMTVSFVQQVPYTEARSLWPVEPPSGTIMKLIKHNPVKFPLVQRDWEMDPSYTNLKLVSRMRSDGEGINCGHIIDAIRHPQNLIASLAFPSSRYFRWALEWDPASSQHKGVGARANIAIAHNAGGSTASITPLIQIGEKKQIKVEAREEVTLLQGVLSTFKSSSKAIRYKYNLNALYFTKDVTGFSGASLFSYRTPVVGTSQKSQCVQMMLHRESPSIQNFQDLIGKLNSGIKAGLDGHVFVDESCNQEKQVATLKGQLTVTENRKQAMIQELKEDSNMATYSPLSGLPLQVSYDTLKCRVTFDEQKWPRSLLNATYWADDIFRGQLYPHYYPDYTHQNDQGVIVIDGSKPVMPERWQITSRMPTCTVNMDNVWMPFQLDRIAPNRFDRVWN